MVSYGVLDAVDVVALHGFPLDWNHWSIHEWPNKMDEIRSVTSKPIWVSEAGASSFGAEEVQVFGLQKTAELLLPKVERVHWYSLFDLPATWTATTRHKESEGSSYYRHYYMGLVREDGTPKLAASHFPRGAGNLPVVSFRRSPAGVGDRSGCSEFGSATPAHRDQLGGLVPAELGSLVRPQMSALEEFETTLTLCFTPEHLGAGAALHEPAEDGGGLRRVRGLGGRPGTRARQIGAACTGTARWG